MTAYTDRFADRLSVSGHYDLARELPAASKGLEDALAVFNFLSGESTRDEDSPIPDEFAPIEGCSAALFAAAQANLDRCNTRMRNAEKAARAVLPDFR